MNRSVMRVIACAVLVQAATGLADPSFRADKNYPDLGLRIRVLGNSSPQPLAPSKTYTYTYTSGDSSRKLDKFDPFELWYSTQHAGQWRDEDGNELILGHATRMLPAFKEKHIAREAFDAAMESAETVFDANSADGVSAWVRAFSQCDLMPPESLRPPSLDVLNAVFFPVEGASTLVYAFRVKTRNRYGKTEPSDWFCALVKIGDGTPLAKARKDFEAQFLGKATAIPRNAAAASGVQPKVIATDSGGAEGAAIPEHPSRIAARKSIANMKDWWYAETAEYIFLSDIRSTAGRSLVKELQATMPALHGAFARLIPPFEPSGDVGVVRIYEDAEAYKQYVGKAHEWSSGVWMPMRRELVILSQGRNRDGTLEIIRHEGFHQYLFYACSMKPTSPWFNEGHACFFEAAEVDRRGKVDIPENRRGTLLMSNLDEITRRLPSLLQVGYEGFYSGTDEQRSIHYTAAWALVYFLWKGAPLERDNPYGGIIETYLKTLAGSGDPEAATTAAFEKIDMARFQKDFGDFWKRRRAAARRIDPLAVRLIDRRAAP